MGGGLSLNIVSRINSPGIRENCDNPVGRRHVARHVLVALLLRALNHDGLLDVLLPSEKDAQ